MARRISRVTLTVSVPDARAGVLVEDPIKGRRYEMALVFHRRLAIPLWAIAFFTLALTAPLAATLFLIAALGLAVLAFRMWLRTSRSVVQVLPSRHRDKSSAALTMAAGTCVRTLDEPNGSTADGALDLLRMDDDGGRQMRDRRPNASGPRTGSEEEASNAKRSATRISYARE
jgi:hypothetical protein